ncbi:MAG: methylated-DNA--[protein]-cysteine S-methyltransferase [Desulfurococcales archaeon]|jgi:methylated-DNA-[protein]-cysteine S-methyltransferase|nr:methylated-DNA--[protein]-cysteine S-methyltransferase [Desulfurococcales archaeon]
MNNDISFCIPRKCGKETLLSILKALLTYIPEGRVTTYKEIAEILGLNPRYVGLLLSINDEPIIYPCHRVVRNNGDLGGYMGKKNNCLKEKLLMFEGLKIVNSKIDKDRFLSLKSLFLT